MSVSYQVRKHSGYEAARSGAAFFIYPAPGYIRIFGEDRLGFLQRQTTNEVMSLLPKRVLMTVLTSPTARIMDVFFLFIDEGDSLGVITLPGFADRTIEFLKKRIFFRDRVSLTDLSREYLQVDLEGPSVPQALLQIGIECPEETDGLAEGDFYGDNLRIFSKPGFIERGFRILIRPDHRSELIDALDSAGVVQLTDEDYEILRVESGMPAPGRELSEEYTPLEVNLDKTISKDKGCYTGQEVIARQINYDKITRRMVGLQLKTLVSTKARVQVDGKQAGEIESVVESPRFGTIALAILKRPHYEPGTEVEVMDEFKQVSGRVCLLPFSELAGAV